MAWGWTFLNFPLKTMQCCNNHGNGIFHCDSPRCKTIWQEFVRLSRIKQKSSRKELHGLHNWRNLCTPSLPFGRPTPHRNCLPETVLWPISSDLHLRESRWNLKVLSIKLSFLWDLGIVSYNSFDLLLFPFLGINPLNSFVGKK